MALTYNTYSLPNQRCSYSNKLRAEWFIPTCNYIINKAMTSDNHSMLKEYFNAASGNISDAALNKVLKPLQGNEPTLSNIKIGNKRSVDIIRPIVRRYLGELIKQYTNFQVYYLDPTSVVDRNPSLEKELDNIIQQLFINEMNNAGFQTGEESQEVPDIKTYIKEAQAEYLQQEVIKGQNRLELVLSETDEKTKIIQAFYYWFATNRVITYRGVMNGDVMYDVISPNEYFRVDSGNPYIKDDDMGCRVFQLSVHQIIAHYGKMLKPKDITYLQEHNFSEKSHPTHSEILSREISSVYDLTTVLEGGTTPITTTDFSRLIECYHAVGKTQRKVQYLTYVNLLGETITIEVSDDYKLDIANGDVELTYEYRDEFWEYYRFGGELEGVYSIPQPVAVQRHLFNEHAYCENPYNGLYGLLKDFHIDPIPYTLNDINILNTILLIQIERTIAKYRPGMTVLPESVLQDSDNYTLAERLAAMLVDDQLIINDEDISANSLQAIRTLTNNSVENYIKTLFEIRKELKQEAYELADMNANRLGDVSPYAGKATTEMSINYSIAGSILLFETFNKLRERDYEALLDASRVAWELGKQGSYVTPEGTVIELSLTTEDNINNIGVFVRNNAIESEKMNRLKDFAPAAMQSGDYSIAAKIVTSDNSTKIQSYIEKFVEATKAYNKSIEDNKNATMDKINQDNIANEQAQRDFDANMEQFKQASETQRTMITAGVSSSNNDVASDMFKKTNENIKRQYENRKLNLMERQQQHKEIVDASKLRLAKEKQATDRYIAKINKN